MPNTHFNTFLEYELTKAFQHSQNPDLKGFWCDGIIPNQPENTYTQKDVNDHRQVILKAYLGKDGQTEYELILKFGSKSLSRFARGLDLTVCVPNPEKADWFEVDTVQHKIVVQLD